jgi:peroxiredoxin
LEIKLNGLEDDKDYLWAFTAVKVGIGIVPVDFRTGEVNPKRITKLDFKRGTLKVNGYIDEPGMYSLRNLNGEEELVFMLDSCDQSIEANVEDLIKDKYVLGYTPFIYRGSKLNKEFHDFWNYTAIKEFNRNYLSFNEWCRVNVKELYGISLEEYYKQALTGQVNKTPPNQEKNAREKAEFNRVKDKRFEELNRFKNKAVLQFIEDNPNSRVGLCYTLCYIDKFGMENQSYEYMSQFMPLFGDQVQMSRIYQYLKEKYELQKNIQIGKVAPDFTVSDKVGDSLQLSDLRGNIVLVEFWESSCNYCAKEKNNLMEMYLKYEEKDFEILSISFDSEKKDWLKKLDEEAWPWLQFRDSLGYDNSTIIKKYAGASIPSYFLINKEGIIVAKELRRSEIATDENHNMNIQLEKLLGLIEL